MEKSDSGTNVNSMIGYSSIARTNAMGGINQSVNSDSNVPVHTGIRRIAKNRTVVSDELKPNISKDIEPSANEWTKTKTATGILRISNIRRRRKGQLKENRGTDDEEFGDDCTDAELEFPITAAAEKRQALAVLNPRWHRVRKRPPLTVDQLVSMAIRNIDPDNQQGKNSFVQFPFTVLN
jgi:hypothetical protein